MLTIREPIKLRTQKPMQSLRQDVAERMQANYGLMRLPIRKEELLHITSETPEIYFAEGDQVNISTILNNEVNQELRMDVINNLINRIMVAQTDNFSYQDTVYISSVLRKLGIRDEKTFMKQVFALQRERLESHKLQKTYEEHREMLMQLFEREETRAVETVTREEAAPRGDRYYLHNEIFNRLDTSKVYQDMRSYARGYRDMSQQIYHNEMKVGEQLSLIQQFHLHSLRKEVTGRDLPLYYFHNNSYEFLQEMTEEVSQNLEEQISAAILLNLTDQSFALRQEQIEENNHYWYSLAGALFQTAENTWKRYENNLIDGRMISRQMMQNLTEVTQARQVEGDTILQMAKEFRNLHQDVQNLESIRQLYQIQNRVEPGRTYEVISGDRTYYLTNEELQLIHQYPVAPDEEEPGPDEITSTQLEQYFETVQQQRIELQKRRQEEIRRTPDVHIGGGSYHQTEEVLNLTYLEQPTAEEEEKTPESITIEQLQKSFETIRQRNQENYQKITELTVQQPRLKDRKLDRKKAQQDALRALEQPGEVLMEFFQTQTQDPVREVLSKTESKLYEMFSDETKEIYRQYLQQSHTTTDTLLHRVMAQEEETEAPVDEARAVEVHEHQETEQRIRETIREYTERVTPAVTQNILQEMQQNRTTEMTFLQYAMTQPEESPLRQEIIRVIEEIQRQELQTQLEQQIQAYTEVIAPVISQDVIREMQQKLVHLQEQQHETVYRNWIQPTEFIWKRETEREVEHLEQMETLQKETETRQERILQAAEASERRAGEPDRETLLHRTEAGDVEEVLVETANRTVRATQERRLTELRETIEKELKRQKQEHQVEMQETRQSQTFRRISLVHKSEEQVLGEEILETLRTQRQQNTVHENRVEQQTVRHNLIQQQDVQQITNQTQVSQINNIEEIVQQNVRKQINQLSDQVYGKIEKKLQTERKRRGYF